MHLSVLNWNSELSHSKGNKEKTFTQKIYYWYRMYDHNEKGFIQNLSIIVHFTVKLITISAGEKVKLVLIFNPLIF